MQSKKIQVQHLESDYPRSDEVLMELQAEQETRWGEERVADND
jgi:hypothetical protein